MSAPSLKDGVASEAELPAAAPERPRRLWHHKSRCTLASSSLGGGTGTARSR